MDFVKNLTGDKNQQGDDQQQSREQGQQSNKQQNSGNNGGFFGGIGDKLNSAAGGGKESEKNEDMLDKGKFILILLQTFSLVLKGAGTSVSQTIGVPLLTLGEGIDMFQQKVLGQGPQDNESAVEQAKDEQISDFIRREYKSTTGSDIPIKDKETRFG